MPSASPLRDDHFGTSMDPLRRRLWRNTGEIEATRQHLRTSFELSSVASGDRDAGRTAACEQWQPSEDENGPAGYCGMPWLPPSLIRPVACLPTMQ